MGEERTRINADQISKDNEDLTSGSDVCKKCIHDTTVQALCPTNNLPRKIETGKMTSPRATICAGGLTRQGKKIRMRAGEPHLRQSDLPGNPQELASNRT
jgi:hypothetical protein